MCFEHRLAAVLSATILAGCLAAERAWSSPSPFTYTEQRFVGANPTHYFYFEFIRKHEGSYYSHKEILRMCARRKANGALEDSILVSEVLHGIEPQSRKRNPPQVRPTAAFDLSAYVRAHSIHLAWTAGFEPPAAVDSIGIYLMHEGRRVYFIRSPGLRQQFPDLEGPGDPAVRTAYQVNDVWNADDSGIKRKQEWYFMVEAGRPGSDTDWGLFLVHAVRELPARAP